MVKKSLKTVGTLFHAICDFEGPMVDSLALQEVLNSFSAHGINAFVRYTKVTNIHLFCSRHFS